MKKFKKCRRCREVKKLDSFSDDNRTYDLKYSFCKNCVITYKIRNRKPAQIRLYKNYYFIGHEHYHRVLMEEHLGRSLSSDYHVHHINRNKLDNRIENLEVLSSKNHRRKHYKEIKHKVLRIPYKKCLCEVCGKKFFHRSPRQIYCSKSCRYKTRSEYHSMWYKANKHKYKGNKYIKNIPTNPISKSSQPTQAPWASVKPSPR